MDFIYDLVLIISSGLSKFSTKNFYLTITAATALSALCAIVCNNYSRLWNKTYRTTLTHKILSGIASVCTFFFVLAFVAFTFLEEVAMSEIVVWKENLKSNNAFNSKCLNEAYYKIKDLGIENFSSFPTPESGGRIIPTSEEESQLLAGKIYSDLACNDFKDEHYFLGIILNTDAGIAPELIKEDMKAHFAKGNSSYLISNGIEISATKIKENLIEQAPRVVTIARIILVILFFIIQAIPFGLIGYAAYKDLKIVT